MLRHYISWSSDNILLQFFVYLRAEFNSQHEYKAIWMTSKQVNEGLNQLTLFKFKHKFLYTSLHIKTVLVAEARLAEGELNLE
jgi:hypothetical protein